MKKLRTKRYFIPILVVAVMAITATVAYAWWTANAAQGSNTMSTGTAHLAIGGGPISLSGLEPQFAPAATAPDADYGAVSYIYVQNTGTTPLMFYIFLADPIGDAGLLSKVHVRIWLQGSDAPPGFWSAPSWTSTFGPSGGPFSSFDGVLSTIWNSSVAGKQYLATLDPSNNPTPIQANEIGVYRIAVWLDSSAGNETQGQNWGFSINAAGKPLTDYMQQGWTGI
jgi:hypothetical protein